MVLRKELGRVQPLGGGRLIVFPFFGNFDGEEDAFKPHSTTGFQGYPPPYWTTDVETMT